MIPTHSFTRSLTFTMIKIHAYFCLLYGLSGVQMNPLNINGRVGESVTISCSDWNIWTDVTKNVKYFCSSPCTEDRHIIKAKYKKTTNTNRIKLYNAGKTLWVTISNLQKSDSKGYYCGVERKGPDPYIEVILNVTDVTDVITGSSTSYTTLNPTTPAAPEAQGFISVIVVITILVVSLKLVKKMMKPRLNTAKGDAQEGAGPDEVYQSLQPMTMDEDQVYSTITPKGLPPHHDLCSESY
ncbi:uncharacterized protein AB9W97_014908 isoform 2-T2 [Spinachia spinachia]